MGMAGFATGLHWIPRRMRRPPICIFILKQNLEKINHHGKRAHANVKGMLQHTRATTGQKEPTNINALADEYLRLVYHGMRAKDKNFHAEFKTDFDPDLPKITVVPQDIGRVLQNLINNAFYAVTKRKKLNQPGFELCVTVITRSILPFFELVRFLTEFHRTLTLNCLIFGKFD